MLKKVSNIKRKTNIYVSIHITKTDQTNPETILIKMFSNGNSSVNAHWI